MADLNHLRWFVTIVELGSFTRAASQHGLTKSAVSKGIMELEKNLGGALLQRTTRRITPTLAGQALYEETVAAINILDQVTSDASSRTRNQHGLLRVAAPGTFIRAFLQGFVPRFLTAYPEIQLQIMPVAGQYDPALADADLLLQTGPLTDSAAGFLKLGILQQAVFASVSLFEEQGLSRPEQVEDIAVATLSGKPGPVTWTFTKGQEKAKVKVRARLIVPDPVLHLAFASAGLGIAIAPLFLADKLLSDGRLKVILPDWRPVDVPLFGLYPVPHRPSPRAGLFLNLLREYLKAEQLDAAASV